MRKPVIGITPLVDTGKDSYWMLPGYMEGIREAGGIPLMLPLCSSEDILLQIVSEADGFLFTGGHDISPGLYGEDISAMCQEVCKGRDEMEKVLFRIAYEQNKPVLGICRGIQLMNAVMGGTLYQDLPSEHPSGTEHHQKPPYDEPVHCVKLVFDSPLYHFLETEIMQVNSYHHQAVKELAPELEAMAISEDGLIEAVYAPKKKFIWAVQWHPEFSYKSDIHSKKIFKAFVKAAS
jgi:putative glutamine amidotransferase